KKRTNMAAAPITHIKSNNRRSMAVSAGGFVQLAGQTANETRGASVTEQAREILATIDTLLAEAGTDKSRLVVAQVWLTDIATFDEFNAVWDAWVHPEGKPARACVEANLADSALTVEVMVSALL